MQKTKTLKMDPDSPDESVIEFAALLLKDGGLVAFPTETVYGIGANFLNKRAVNRLYKIKKRPTSKPFTIHISNIDVITGMGCEISPFAELLIKHFWPGPLTLILKSGKEKYGFRMPKNIIAKELIAKSKVPVVAPSANISGEAPATEAGSILKSLDGEIDLILDSGKTECGRESTIIDTSIFPYKILRIGAISADSITEVWNRV